MTLDTLIMFAGTFVAVLPFLGFPTNWDTVLLLLAGIFIIGLGIALRRRISARQHMGERRNGTFQESGPLLRSDHESR